MSGSAPTLQVLGRTTIQKVRKIPPGATVSVNIGERVDARKVIASAEIQGRMYSVAAAQLLGVSKAKLGDYLNVKTGDKVVQGQVIGRQRTLFGLFQSEVQSPVSGVMESISSISGHVMVREAPSPLHVRAFVPGTVVAVDMVNGVTISSDASLVQGVFGVGPEVVAQLCTAQDGDVSMKAVCVFEKLTLSSLLQLKAAGAVAVVAPSMDGEDLLAFCGEDLNLAATGDENVGMTLLLTEGFGSMETARAARAILTNCLGKEVSVCGVTQVRAGVIRPELIGPPWESAEVSPLETGGERHVKITRGEYLGEEGVIREIPAEPCILACGVTTLVYRVQLKKNGVIVDVPRPNVE